MGSNYLKEYKKLNAYGEMIGIKRKLFEFNFQYRKRIIQKLNCPTEFTRTKKKFLEALEVTGFILDKFEIKEDYEKQKITAVIEML